MEKSFVFSFFMAPFLVPLSFFFLSFLFFFLSVYWICYTIASVVYVLVFWPQDVWDLSSPTRDGTHTLAMEAKVLTAGLPGSPSPLFVFIQCLIAYFKL